MMIKDVEHLFMCLSAICMSSLQKCVFKSSDHFFKSFFKLLSYISCSYILDINPLLVILLANIFSHIVGCLFILLMVSFSVQVFTFKYISFIYFCFYFPSFRRQIKKNIIMNYIKECPTHSAF